MSYRDQHTGALATLTERGAAVTFTQTTTDYTPTTGIQTVSTSTVVGYAIRAKGDPRQYADLGLVQREPVTLVFTPTTYGQVPALGATVTWNSTTYIVENVSPVAPDGNAILSRVVIARGG